MITVRGLHKYFFRHKKNEIHVLNDMSISFPDRGLVVLLGASGSGKTTLLNVIGGLDSVQQGTIQFDEQVIEGYKSAVWDKIRNESIGYIFQNYNLLPHLSVYDNVALVLKMAGITSPEDIEARVNYILKAVNMYPFRKKKSTQLSGGQQQRVAIARALVKNPRVIIADEPTGNLDSKNTLEIMNIIKEISKEKLVVLVTHERDLAQIYGDRIIEIKDGQVINDYENDPTHEHALSDDNIVYLKDMIERHGAESDAVKIQYFQDTEQKMDPINIRLIVRNRTLYLDVDAPIEKVKLLDASSNLIIKDEHYAKKNKEEMLETTFRTEHLENKHVKREYKTIVSIKQVFMLALQKILYSSRKGKLMLFSFIISGAVVAVVIAMAASAIIPDLSSRRYEDNYVVVYDQMSNIDNSKKVTYQELTTMLEGESPTFINTTSMLAIGIVDPLEPERDLITMNTGNDLIDFVQGRIFLGRKAIADDEFMISRPLAEAVVNGVGAEYGIWTFEHLMSEQFQIAGIPMKLTGIVESDIRVAYTSRALMNAYHSTYLDPTGMIKLYGRMMLNEKEIIHGTTPTGSQVAVSTLLFFGLTGQTADQVTFPITPVGFNYEIAGVFLSTENEAIASDSTVERLRFARRETYYVYTPNPKDLIEKLEEASVTDVYDEIQQLKLNFQQNTVELRITMSVVALVVIGFALLGFYFVMHSSMVSRIYEIAVYRALGMKKSELMISFLIEVLILSTITSLIGFAVSSYALILASDTLIGLFRLFLVTPLSVLVGILVVYGINILGGMLPILLLLRKTPAQILSQYDI